MKFKLLNFILASLFITSGCQSKPEYYVSPSGNDLHQGTKEKPFATIQKATEEVRSILHNQPRTDITIYLDGGIYWLKEPIILKSEDSGNGDFRVTYRALTGKEPVISGGIQINGWEKQEKNIWVAKIPQINGNPWNFRELFVEGQRARRARHPNKGYMRIAESGSDNRTNFYYNPGDFPLPELPQETELILLHDWSITRINIKEIDCKENKITAVDSIGAKVLDFFTIGNWEQQPRYFLENSMEFLDQPFEWYLDSKTQNLYLMLPKGIDPQGSEIIAPYAENLLSLMGSENKRIRNITFDGITFSHCAFSLPKMGYAGIQACHFDPREGGATWSTVPCALNTSWAENIVFDNCTFTHLGGSGIRLGEGSINCSISNCRLSDISGNGIMVGEGLNRLIGHSPWWQAAPGQAAAENRVEDCNISETGQQFYGAVGIWSGITVRTLIKNNQISDLPYTGISIGWHWSTEPTPCRGVRIEGNHIHHIMKTLSDGGGIYTLGLQPEGRIIGNHIHHVDLNAGRAESNGMFLDEGTTGLTISNNLIYHIAKSPLRFHKATTNLVSDNTLVCGENIPPVRYNRTDKTDIVMEGNRILSATSEEDLSALTRIIKTRSPKTPNLLIIFPDQLRGQSLGFMGLEQVLTPNIDRFASQSLVLTQAATNYPICSPTRAMLMSGKYPHANGVLSNCNSYSEPYGYELKTGERTWSDVLKEKGYSLGYVGKWHLDNPQEPFIDCANNKGEPIWNEWCPPQRRHGFDYWYAYGTYDYHLRPMYWTTGAGRNSFHYVDQWGPEHEADMAVRYIKNDGDSLRKSGNPFALVVSMNPPHMPYEAVPEKYKEIYEDIPLEELCRQNNIPPPDTKWGDYYREHIKNYYAMITGVDEQFGRILTTLKEEGLEEETIVIFLSDHGNCLGMHDAISKNNFYEESMRIPFIIRWPDQIEPRHDDLLLSIPDIYPTLLDLMGFPEDIPEEVMGTDRALLFLTGYGKRPSSQLYLKVPVGQPALGTRGVRNHRYTFAITKYEDKPEERVLFDNQNDPYQMSNLALTHPDMVGKLTEALYEWLKETGDPWLNK